MWLAALWCGSLLGQSGGDVLRGVGEKVADCTLLFGLSHIEAFPKDVWIKRAMATLFDGELPTCALPYAGIAQQYIFHYARMTKLDV